MHNWEDHINKDTVLMRILDANKYRLNIPTIKSFLENKTKAEQLDLIKILAIITNVPIIIVASYVGEIYGFSDKLNHKINRLCDFYKIDEVINVNKSEISWLGKGHPISCKCSECE